MSRKRFKTRHTSYRQRPGAVAHQTAARDDLGRSLGSRSETLDVVEARAELVRLAAASTVTPTRVPEGRRTVSEAQMHAVVGGSDDRRYRYPRAEQVEARLGIHGRGRTARDSSQLARDVEAARKIDPQD